MCERGNVSLCVCVRERQHMCVCERVQETAARANSSARQCVFVRERERKGVSVSESLSR